MGFGDRLRREREMRGVSLEEMAHATKIGTRALRALEEEEFQKLPGGIFNRGFVRAYARFLGMDEEQSVADYLAAAAEAQQKEGLDAENLKKLASNWERPKTEAPLNVGRLVGAAVLVLILAGTGVYGFLHYRSSPFASRLPTLGRAKTSAVQPAIQRPVVQPPIARQPNPTVVSQQPGAATSPPPVSSIASTPLLAGSPRPADENSGPANGSRVPPASSAEGFEVAVFAREASWISVVADGRQLMRGMLTAKQSMSFRAREKMMLVAGNSGGVDVSFNGKRQPPLGETRTPRTVNFSPGGMMP